MGVAGICAERTCIYVYRIGTSGNRERLGRREHKRCHGLRGIDYGCIDCSSYHICVWGGYLYADCPKFYRGSRHPKSGDKRTVCFRMGGHERRGILSSGTVHTSTIRQRGCLSTAQPHLVHHFCCHLADVGRAGLDASFYYQEIQLAGIRPST
ncbi:hypothetical protein D9M69_566410 [compost metagenome]